MFNRKTLAAALVALISLTAATTDDVTSLKGVYMDRSQHPTTLGARFHIQLLRADGKKINVPASYAFHSGDHFWLELEVRTGVYVYVMNRTLGGSDKALEVVRDEDNNRTPPPAAMPRLVFGPEKVEAGKFRPVPGTSAMAFDKETGIEKLYIILSAKPVPELESALFSGGRANSQDTNSSALQNLDKSMVLWGKNAQQAIPSSPKGVVIDNPDGYAIQRNPAQPILVEVTLHHAQ